jgi:hypothetical protein
LVALAVPTTAFGTDRPAIGLKGNVLSAATDDTFDDATPMWDLDDNGLQTVNDTLDAGEGDSLDVYAIWLEAGEEVSLSLGASGSGSWGLRLYDPYGQQVDLQQGDTRAPVTATLKSKFSYWHFVSVETNGAGPYTMSASITRKDSIIELTSAARTLKYDTYPTMTGYVMDRFGGTPSGDLYFFYSFDGLSWMPLESQAYSGGEFSFDGWYQWRKTYYLATFEGNDSYTTGSQGAVYGTYAKLTNPIAPTTMYKRKYKTVYGYIEPKHTAGSYPVRIYKYKKVSGKWKSYGYVSAKAYTINDGKSKYARSLYLPSTGSWRLRAYAPADSQHAATWSSGYDYVTVK